MTKTDKNIKRFFDIIFSCIGLLLTGWLILLIILISKLIIRGNGIFKQKRIGQYGKLFVIYKIETIHPREVSKVNIQITFFGKILRKYKIDELPQLWNVLEGTMSFVGPRPDIQGFADLLEGDDKTILNIKPGITGPATLHFRNEEEILQLQDNPETYSREVIWPQKIILNRMYINEYSFFKDIKYLFKTLLR
jgi:lipopolysaccharide/colanic/teichoic acid biosynthesis glycosyltransferase